MRAAAVLLGALLVAGCPAGERASARPAPRNLVVVSLDALQASHVGALGYGRDVTPNLDRLARRSFLFSRAYSAASWTVPATMTWFTGVYPSEHRLTNKFAVYSATEKRRATLDELAPGLETLAELMRRAGYRTAAFTGNAGVHACFGFSGGFSTYDHEDGKFGTLERSVPRALDWLARNGDARFFLFLHGYDAHAQSRPARLEGRFVDAGYDGRYRGDPLEQELLREEGLAKGRIALRDEDVRFWRAIYDEKIARADALLGTFLRGLEDLGLARDTLLLVTSDHGTELHEHGRLDHGFTLYEELIRVPLVLHLPGKGAGLVTDRVSSVDLFPTVLELLGLGRPPQALRGTSLVPSLEGRGVPREVFAETDYREYTFKRAVIAPDGWKLILTLEDGRRELYDLNADPCETRDLSALLPERARALEGRVREHWRSLGHDLGARRWVRGLNPVYDSQGR